MFAIAELSGIFLLRKAHKTHLKEINHKIIN